MLMITHNLPDEEYAPSIYINCLLHNRCASRGFSYFRLQRPPLCGWSAVARRVALTYAGTIVVALAAYQAGRPDLIRSPTRVLAHLWEPHEGSS